MENDRRGGSNRAAWMGERRRIGFLDDFKTFFTRGLAILLPSVLTLALLWWAYGFLRDRVAEPINGTVRQVIIWSAPQVVDPERLPEWFAVTDEQVVRTRAARAKGLPAISDAAIRRRIRSEAFTDWWHNRWYMQALGFAVAVVVVYLAGVLVGNLIGKRAIVRAERLLTTLPVIRQVYPNIKQVVEFLFGGEKEVLHGNRVVVVEYPRKGVWSVGLMTGDTMKSIEMLVGEPCVTIFIPSSPTPFTGYTITVPRSAVVELPVSLDDALRFCVSGGVLVPPGEMIERGAGQLEAGSELAGRAEGDHRGGRGEGDPGE